MSGQPAVIRSYAEANREFVAAFRRYLISRGLSSGTVRAYNETMQRLVEFLDSTSVLEADRSVLLDFLGRFFSRGLTASSIHRHTQGLRAFYKFASLAGRTRYDPTLLIAHRKLPKRLPVVLSEKECERLIGAARDPFERAVAEVLYDTGARVSELVNLRLDDIRWADDSQPSSIRIHRGKGDKDRVVFFGDKAADAIRAYQEVRPPEAGFLFEAPARQGNVWRFRNSWKGRFYVDKVQRTVTIFPRKKRGLGPDNHTRDEAKRELDRLTARIPGFIPVPARQYTARAIRLVLKELGRRAGLARVHPHALRRAFASHLVRGGADIRFVQELMGHKWIKATAIYVHLSAPDLKAVHAKAHPHG